MRTNANTADARERALEIADQLAVLGSVSVTRFFSGAAILIDGLQCAFIIKGSLYLRVDDEGRKAFEAMGTTPFTYAGRSGKVTVASYYETPSEIIDDHDELRRWALRARQAALLKPKPRRKAG